MSCGDLTVFKHSLPISHFFCRTIITLSLASLSVCNIIWFYLNPLCFHDLALLPGEKPPDPTVPVPKKVSENEEENSVEIQIPNMKLSEVTALKRKLLNFSEHGDSLSRKLFDSCNFKGFFGSIIQECLGVTAFFRLITS